MEKDLAKLQEVLSKKIPGLVEAIEKADATSEEYGKLLGNFNSSMVVYSEIVSMFASRLRAEEAKKKEDKKDGTNN